MNTRHRLLAGATGLVGVLGVGSLSAVAATAPQPSRSAQKATLRDYTVEIGPFRAKGGFEVDIAAAECGTKSAAVTVDYAKGNAEFALDHTYGKRAGICTVSKSLETSTVKVQWGTALKLNLTVSTTAKLRTVSAGDGCTKDHVEYRTGTSAGTGTLKIHTTAFGTLHLKRDAVRLLALTGSCASSSGSGGVKPIKGGPSGFIRVSSRGAFARAESDAGTRTDLALAEDTTTTAPATTTTTTTTPTTTTAPTTTTTPTTTTAPTTTSTTTTGPAPTVTGDDSGTQFVGVFSRNEYLVISAATDPPYAPLTIINDYRPDAPAPGVVGEMDVAVATRSSFVPATGDGEAQVSVGAPFAHGTLTFTATKRCAGTAAAVEGTLAGAIVVDDPVFGTLTYNGPTAAHVAVGNGDADLASC